MAAFLTLAAVGLTVPSAFAQSVPPGAAAPVPLLPVAATVPPDTVVPEALSDLPIQAVVFSYFGPYADVLEVLIPVRVIAASDVEIWSAPDATTDEAAGAVDFGARPAGSEFITFFIRGTRTYVFDTTTGNYGWVDNNYVRT